MTAIRQLFPLPPAAQQRMDLHLMLRAAGDAGAQERATRMALVGTFSIRPMPASGTQRFQGRVLPDFMGQFRARIAVRLSP